MKTIEEFDGTKYVEKIGRLLDFPEPTEGGSQIGGCLWESFIPTSMIPSLEYPRKDWYQHMVKWEIDKDREYWRWLYPVFYVTHDHVSGTTGEFQAMCEIGFYADFFQEWEDRWERSDWHIVDTRVYDRGPSKVSHRSAVVWAGSRLLHVKFDFRCWRYREEVLKTVGNVVFAMTEDREKTRQVVESCGVILNKMEDYNG